MKIEASKRTHVSAQKALTAAVETAIIIPEISGGDSRIRCPGVCASRLYFLLHFHNRSFESVRGCHAPVLGRQGTAEMRRRAPTYRERWVKNDDSGTLGFLFFQNQNAVQSGTAFSFYTIIDKKRGLSGLNRTFQETDIEAFLDMGLCPIAPPKGFPFSAVCFRHWRQQPKTSLETFGQKYLVFLGISVLLA